MRRYAEVSITGGSKWQVEPETLNVQHHRNAANQTVLLSHPAGRQNR